jgi:hypothetical protein
VLSVGVLLASAPVAVFLSLLVCREAV